MRYRIDCGLIEKRMKAIHNGYERHDCKMLLDRTLVSETSKSSSRKTNALKLFTECSGPSNANNYYQNCLSIIEMENSDDPKFAKTLAEKFNDSVLPYVIDVQSVSESLDRYKIDPKLITSIDEACNSYKICDRIIDNHNKISKRFNMESFVRERRNRDTKGTILECCKMIDTYKLKPHAKMNICLEEMSYLFQKQAVNYSKKDLAKYVTEYFLTNHNNTAIIQDNYKMVLSENSMISDTDLKSVSYFVEGEDNSRSIIQKALHRLMLKEDGVDISVDLISIINNVFSDDEGRQDVVYNIGKVLDYARDYLFTDAYNIDEVFMALNRIPEKIEACMNDNTWLFNREDLDSVVDQYASRIPAIETDMANNTDADQIDKLVRFKDYCVDTIKRLNVLRSTVYPAYNIESMRIINAMTEASHPLYLNEFKIFKFNNLISAAMKAANNIIKSDKKLGKNMLKKIMPKKKRGKNILKLAMEDTLTADNRASVLVAEYDIVDNENFYEAQDYLTSMCRSINDSLITNECKCYYIVTGETVEVYVEDDSYILDGDDDDSMHSMHDDDLEIVLDMEEYARLAESVDVEAFEKLAEAMWYRTEEMDFDRTTSIIEASQYVETLSKDDVDRFVQEVQQYCGEQFSFTESTTIKNMANSWSHIDAPLEIQEEAVNIIYSCLESDGEKLAIQKLADSAKDKAKSVGDKAGKSVDAIRSKFSKKDKEEDKDKSKDKDSGKDDEKKNPFAGVNLANIKIALNGLKAKMKDLSTKEQNLCKNMDMEATRLYNETKRALTNDRREGIIKGSVIPSFSRCVKAGIALCGIGLVTGNPAIPCIAAVGAMAASKTLTAKERMLMADDIDVELEVVNKEIDRAEAEGKTKKYRELLKMKKDLERQKARIKYNTRIGKDILPGSASGTYHHDNK